MAWHSGSIHPSLLLIATLFVWLVLPGWAVAAPRALMLGGSEYRDADLLPDLPGIEHDLDRMRALAVERLGFAPEQIRVLQGEQLRRSAVLDAFDWLSGAGEDDPVLIYYSGHGYQIPDRNGDERDRFDEILPLYGYGAGSAEYLLDDEIRTWVDALPSARRTVIVDACCSGTGSRADESDAGGWVIKSPGCPARSTAGSAMTFVDGRAAGHVYLGAAQDNQLAVTSASGSAFTTALVAAFEALGAQATPSALVEHSADYLAERLPRVFAHQPSLEGPVSALQVPGFLQAGAARQVRSRLLAVQSAQDGAQLSLGDPVSIGLRLPYAGALQVWAIDSRGRVNSIWPRSGQSPAVEAGGLDLPRRGQWQAGRPLGQTVLVALLGRAPLQGARLGQWQRALARSTDTPAPPGWLRADVAFTVCDRGRCR